jgi:hypothetical protein
VPEDGPGDPILDPHVAYSYRETCRPVRWNRIDVTSVLFSVAMTMSY